MVRNFHNVQKFLEGQFPELEGKIAGANYPPPPTAELLSNLMWMIQLTAIAWMVMGGEKIFRLLGFKQQLPGIYYTINENSMPIAIALFLIVPQFIGRFTLTGAFEIYLDDQVVFSKLNSGAFPTESDLVDPLIKAGLTRINQ